MTQRHESVLDEPLESVMLAGGHHSLYVATGLVTDALEGHEYSLDMLIIVVDGDKWCTLHRLQGIWRGGGRRRLNIGPRIPWPDGAIAARKLPQEAAVV